jgi:signal transduction histidine kinase
VQKHQVRVSDPKGGIRKVPVGTSGITIGSGKGADILIEGDVRLSFRHGKLWVEGGQIWYQDTGSSFGSFVEGQRVRTPVALAPGVAVRLSETHLSLDEAADDEELDKPPTLIPGMELRMQGRAGSDGLVDALGGQASALYVAAIYDIVERILRASSKELLPEALRQLRTVVPAAQRVNIVAWPPGADGHLVSLLPLNPGEETGVSTTAARYAVERRRALLVADGGIPEGFQAGPSMLGIRSAVYVPLVSRSNEVLGLLCVDSPNPTLPLTNDDFQFICAIGGLLSSTLATERLREEARQQQLDTETVKARREALVSFLQIASHDLKNQLTAIVTGATMIQMVPAPEQKDRLAGIVLNAGGRATDLIKAYLDVAEVESGHALSVDWTIVEPQKLLEEEMSVLNMAFHDRIAGLVLRNEVHAGQIRADERKLRQILCNLVSNAIKYTPNGGEILVTREDLPGEVRFHVKDNGVGISVEDQQKLFTAFQRVGDLSMAPGTGLGLWLTASLVAAQGGNIWVTSAAGQGATFSFNIPQPRG